MEVRRLVDRLRLRRDGPAEATDHRLDDLTERLRLMRGNVTTPMEAGKGTTRAGHGVDKVERMARAARDALWIDRSNEDRVLENTNEYRSIDDPK